jgi:BirA family transcriptional regulator, biotin operon repressor / biotin---[acetyl-CoA-carboxylase] ligase
MRIAQLSSSRGAAKRRLEGRTTLMQLPPNLSALGDTLITFDTIDSTMDEARRRFDLSMHTRLWIIAGEQGAGRGRLGRQWQSPPGNLHLTLLSPTHTPLRDQPKLGFVAGVALARAVSSLLPDGATLRLKWPNDLLLEGAKVSGLLLEGLGQGAAIAIGIGVNIVAHPPDTPYPAAHLRRAAPGITRESLFAKLAVALVEEIDLFANGSGFPLTRQRWLARAAHLGQSIRIRQGETSLEGIFRDIDTDGRLLLETSGGLARIDAGDVFPLDK